MEINQVFSPQAQWNLGTDLSSIPFFIRRIDTSGYVKASEVPEVRVPLISFIYVVAGEILVEADGVPFLCQPGHILLVPQHCPFLTRYYRNVIVDECADLFDRGDF